MAGTMLRAAAAAALAAALAGADPVSPHYADPTGLLDPWGIHIAYGSDPTTQVTVAWSTRLMVNSSVVLYGLAGSAPTTAASGDVISFSDSGNIQTIHRVHLSNLLPGTAYAFTVGDGGSLQSPVFNFTTAPRGDWRPTFAIYGDMGITPNAEATMPWLIEDARTGVLDVVLHIGDAAYNLDSTAGLTGDAWMTQIQPLASIVPYHMCPGNHETANDFYQYRMRLGMAMPPAVDTPSAGGNGTFHSLNIGPVHVVMVSSEVYFGNQPHSGGLLAEQEKWLAADLAAVNRSVTPFVVLGLHQPFYCSPNDDSDDCHQAGSLVRSGLEPIIYAGGVDMVFGAHEHSYERNYPVYNSTWDSSRTGPGAYVDYTAPIHILTGAAGCPENEDPWQAVGNPFSALRINDYGYGRLTVLNRTALEWVYVDNQKGEVKDRIVVVKSSEGPAFPPAAAQAWRERS